jgi:hypothetical protein
LQKKPKRTLAPHANSAPLRQQRPELQNSPDWQHTPWHTVPVQLFFF